MTAAWTVAAFDDVVAVYQPETLTVASLDQTGPYEVYGANGVIGNHNRYNHEHSELLLGCRGTVGSVNWSKPRSWINGNAMVVRPRDERIDRRFLYYYLAGGVDLARAISGTAQPQITRKSLATLRVPVPPLAEQQRIVAKLDVVSTHAAQLDHVAEVTASRWRDLYASVCREAFEPRFGWKTVALPEISENLDGIRRPVTRSNRKPGPYPYYGASGIVDHVADYLFDEKLLLVSEDGANLLARSTPIAFTATGKYWVNNHAHVLRFGSPTHHAYVEAYLNSISIDEWVTGAAQPKLTQGALNRIPIPIPGSESETVAVLNLIENAQATSTAGGASSERRRRLTKDLKKSVLDAAFRGDL